MKRKVNVVLLLLMVAGVASATPNVPAGYTGLWRFQDYFVASGFQYATMAATVGTDLVNSNPDNGDTSSDNGIWFTGPWTQIGIDGIAPDAYSNNGVAQIRSNNELTCYHGIAPNGGGSYVNEYTIAMDYVQTSGLTTWNSLYQTAGTAHANDGDLWTDGAGHIGVGVTGYSTLTYDASTWHRIVLSVDNANFFRVYVDGVLFLDAPGQGIDGRFSLNPYFYLFADNDWEDQWGLVGTVATWGRALTTEEIAPMGGWIGGASMPTPLLIIPEPATLALLALGGLTLVRRKR
ncbi:MAG: PEP-CTERM sorting domain-containing protein [Sedimentisphaerales bacterium]|nr:PEP-CTERM sorting domain-containing protein [Sedimentisphaerales bacterium]